jgi:Fe2+ or Zn2+ uptake regulation protein
MIEQLFGSKTRVKLLRLFFENSERAFYVREITRRLEEQINSIRRELSNLLSVGVIKSETKDNKIYYTVNNEYLFYGPFKEIFGTNEEESSALKANSETTAAKSSVLDNSSDIVQMWSKAGNIDAIVYTGNFTMEPKIDIDVLVIGDVNIRQVENILKALEKSEDFEIRYMTMSKDEYIYRTQIKDRLWSRLVNSKTKIVVNKNSVLGF